MHYTSTRDCPVNYCINISDMEGYEMSFQGERGKEEVIGNSGPVKEIHMYSA